MWKHHSRDLQFERVLHRTVKVAMADNKKSKANGGWLCGWCRVMSGKHANCCHSCGGHWQEVGEDFAGYYRSGSQRHRQQQAEYQQWPQRPKSPRTKGRGKGRGKSPRPRHRNQESDPQQNAQTAQTAQQDALAVPSVTSGLSWMQAAQTLPVPNPATPAESTAGAVPQEYRGLIDSLKRNQMKGTLPDDVQQEMKSLKIKEEKEQNKELNQAVKGLRKARKELQEAFEARSQLHTQWRKFLSLSVTQWQGFTSQFQAQETVAVAKITEAQQALQEAKAQLASSKEIAELSSTAEGAAAEVDIISEDETAKAADSVTKMKEGMHNLTSTLEQLQQAAEDIHASEQAAKRARLHGQEDVSGLPGSGALEPFAEPGIKRPPSAGA